MSTLLMFLKQTPWWVYVLFFYLLSIGINATQPKVVSIVKLAILPVLFTVLSIHTLMTAFALTNITIAVWGASILVGTLLGILLVAGHPYKVDRAHRLILLPGTWVTLILILFIFASKYYFGYELSSDPSVTQNTNFEFIMLSISGACTGLFVGRFICYLYHFFSDESVDLKIIN